MTESEMLTEGAYAVVHDDAAHRYVARTPEGDELGELEYVRDGDRLVYPHTEVRPAHEGKGVASALARAALDDARAAGASIVPACSFVEGYVERHPEYQDLLAR